MLIEYFKKIAQKIAKTFTFRTKSEKHLEKVPVLAPPALSTPQTPKNPVGRPRKFSTAAEKQKDYRQRKKQAELKEFRKYIDATQVEAVEKFIEEHAQTDKPLKPS